MGFYRLFSLIALTGMVLMVLPDDGFAQDRKQRTLTMTGTASVGAAPDRVEINLGVTSKAKTARDALTKNTANMNAIFEALKKNGIEKKYIQTSNFSIQADYKHFKNGEPPVVQGYNVNNTVLVQVTDIEKLGVLLDEVVSSGSNQIHGIRFYVSKADELKDEARKLAVEKAKRKASLYAQAAGVGLGDLMSLHESSQNNVQPRAMSRRVMAEASPVPIAGGEQQLGVSVTMTWLLK